MPAAHHPHRSMNPTNPTHALVAPKSDKGGSRLTHHVAPRSPTHPPMNIKNHTALQPVECVCATPPGHAPVPTVDEHWLIPRPRPRHATVLHFPAVRYQRQLAPISSSVSALTMLLSSDLSGLGFSSWESGEKEFGNAEGLSGRRSGRERVQTRLHSALCTPPSSLKTLGTLGHNA